NAASGGNLLNKTTREALQIIENKSKISNLVEIVNKQVIAPAKAVEKTCVTCGGAHAYYECIATDSNPSSVCATTGSYNQVSLPNRASHQIPPPGFAPVQNNPNRFNQSQGNYFNQENNFNQGNNFNRGNNFQNNQGYRAQMNNNQPSTSGTLPSNTIPNPKGEMKAVTTRSGLAYEGPSIPTESPLEKVDEQITEEILDKEHSNCSGSTAQVQPPVVPISILKPDVSRTQSKPTIPYPSSFADALLLMPKFASTIKSLLANKDKLFELAKVPLNENCSAMLLKKIPEKLEDPGKFLIHCNFPGMNVCHALTNLGASINLMPLSIWKKNLLPELTPTRMTLELADRSITRPKGVAEDVFVKVGKIHFPTDFVVVDFEADPRVPLILMRAFLRTGRTLINVYEEEITLRVNDKSVTFNLDQVMKYFDNYVSRVNVINIASEEVVHDNTKSSNPTLVSKSDFCEDPIVKTSPFGESDFCSKEIEIFLKDDSIPLEIENSVFDSEGDILLIEKLLNEDSCQIPLINLNQVKSPIEEPEYSFSMGYEHFSTTLVTRLDEVAESSAKNLVPIQTLMPIHIAEEERIRIEHAEYISLMERLITINPCPRLTVNANTIVESLPSSLILVQDNDSQREEIDIVTDMDELLPLSFENDDNNSEGKIYVLEGLHVDNSILNSKNELSDNEASDFDNLSFPRPPPKPPDAEFNFESDAGEEILVVMNNNDELECLDPRDEIDVSTNDEDDDYFPFMFVIRIFLPYLIYFEVFPFLLSAESEDTIFDPGVFV
nr:reverse transcriptase domain-containing protein [Tanacetum cinerariifolium]